MICAWKEFLSVIPVWMRREVNEIGREELQELRLRINAPPELCMQGRSIQLKQDICQDDLSFCVNLASNYSPWNALSSAQGYITAPGGHRIGVCGRVILKEGRVSGFREISSLCIRVARDIRGIGKNASTAWGSFLIIGPPGFGKTTLLRDCIRQLGRKHSISVVDEREEIFPSMFDRGNKIDVLLGCPKRAGIEMLMRTMRPEYIAVDEITSPDDCDALTDAVGCGVKLAATAHAASYQDFLRRPINRKAIELHLFDTILTLDDQKHYSVERIPP